MNKTPLPVVTDLKPTWHVIDAADQRLGRLATVVANLLRGKHKPNFTPHLDTGDHVIVINAEKVQVTGRKRFQKVYRRHSGRPGGMKTETFAELQARLPERVVEKAVKGMLPHTRLGRQQFTKLKVYAGSQHPHEAQQPQIYAINTIPGA
jgi:large subunit ribosomal protein L13